MPKIVTISMVKNEADIIESFVRHTLTFADEMIICDHMSDDNTLKILELLVAEGLPLFIRHSYRAERIQEKLTNDMLIEAMLEHDADYVVPLDADEFLVNITDDEPVRDIICQLDPMGFYLLHWMRFTPMYPDRDQDKYLLSRPAKKERAFSTGNKSLVPAAGWHNTHCGLMEGAHGPTGKCDISGFAPKLLLAHYFWRSEEQSKSKFAVGWLTLTADHSRDSYYGVGYKNAFDKVVRGEPFENDFEDYEDWNWTGNIYRQVNKYGSLAKIDVLSNVLRASETLAARFAEERVRNIGKTVSVIILPILPDQEANFAQIIRENVRGLVEAGDECRINEIVLLRREESKGGGINLWLAEAVRQKLTTKIHVVEFSDDRGYAEDVSNLITGDYVQFLEVDIRINHDKLIRQASVLAKNEVAFALSMGVWSGSNLVDMYCPSRQEPLLALEMNSRNLQVFVGNGRPFYGGISSALFRRENMHAVQWFEGSFIGHRFSVLSAIWMHFKNINNRAGFGVMSAELVCLGKSMKQELEDIIWWQIERGLLLQEVGIDIFRCDDSAFMVGQADEAIRQATLFQVARIREYAHVLGVSEKLIKELEIATNSDRENTNNF